MSSPTSDDRPREWTGDARAAAVTIGLLIIAIAAGGEAAIDQAGPLLACVAVGLAGL